MPLLTLEKAGPRQGREGTTAVVALAHNERPLVGDFLRHYRAICRPSFLIVDDHSDDGTAELFAAEPDVTLFRPRPGSTYDAHKAEWRRELLDAFAVGRWCLVPDLDEHFVFPRMEARPLEAYIAELEAEAAEAVLTIMVDMYRDAPLSEPPFEDGSPLRERFPLFDGPGRPPEGYSLVLTSTSKRRGGITPVVEVHGGVRHRLFGGDAALGPLARAALERWAHLGRPVAPGPVAAAGYRLARTLTRGHFHGAPLMQKLGLLRWRAGARFSGGPHAVRAPLAMSESIAAFLHFKFVRGEAGLAYLAARGRHFDGSRLYRSMLDQADRLAVSPVFAGTRRYADSGSLGGIIREAPRR